LHNLFLKETNSNKLNSTPGNLAASQAVVHCSCLFCFFLFALSGFVSQRHLLDDGEASEFCVCSVADSAAAAAAAAAAV